MHALMMGDRFLAGLFADSEAAQMYKTQCAQGMQTHMWVQEVFDTMGDPLFLIEDVTEDLSSIGAKWLWADQRRVDEILDLIRADEGPEDRERVIVFTFDGTWHPPESHKGRDYMGALDHTHWTNARLCARATHASSHDSGELAPPGPYD